MARNVYDICHPLGIIENLQDTRFLMEKYATKVPSTREDIAPDGTIIEDVPNGYVYTMNLLALIDNEIFPAIEKKCTSVNGECTVLYTYDGLRLAYQ